MTNPFFQTELNNFKELASKFARANPALAPLLDGNKTDPDVERLLEALAYQIAMFRQKLAVDFPELITNLFRLILPHYLQAIPASTTISFKTGGGDIELIPASTQVSSAPVDGTPIPFTTTCDVEVHPLELTDAIFIQQPGRAGQIRLSLVLNGTTLSRWQPKELRIFLPGDHAAACERFLLLDRHVTRIILTPLEGGAGIELPPGCLTSAGFAENETLLPYPSHAYPVYRQLQEYFNAPEKFFSFTLTGWERWNDRGEGTSFTISFEVSDLPLGLPTIRRDNFALNCAHAVNTFSHQADPISIDHRTDHYLVWPAGSNPDHLQILSVDSVTGFRRETGEERRYRPFELFSQDSTTEPLYHTVQEKSQHGSGLDVYVSVVFPGEIPLADSESLSIDITCTNKNLPENLHIGDIRIPVSELPETISFRNITAISPGLLPPLGPELLQRLTTHISLDLLSLEHVEHLRTLMELYVFPDNRSGAATSANLKRISGIESISIIPGEQMVAGIPVKGREIRIKIRQDHFAGAGDMYLFGCVLDHFFGGYASANTYTRLTFNETTRGLTRQWPIRLGNCNQAGLVFKPGPVTAMTNKPSYHPVNLNTNRAEPDNKKIPSLIDDLLSHAHEFSFPQVMRLLRKTLGTDDTTEIPWQERVRVRPDLSLGFPAADVARIERMGQDNANFLVTNTFGGVYGVSAPMPTFYTEDLMDEASNDSSVSRDFLDILHQRLFFLFFQVWSKYRLFIRIAEEKNPLDLERLSCLLGLGEKELRDAVPESWPLLRYIGLFIHTVRSALGLQTLLRDALGVSCLTVEQCVLRKVPIPAGQRMSLGLSGMSLGVNTVLGSEIHDRTGKIRIHIGPLKKKEFDSFLPGTPLYDKLMRLIWLYFFDPFVFELRLTLAAGEAVPIRLGDPNSARLGLGTWCFSSKTLGEVSITFIMTQSAAQTPDPEDDFGYAPEMTEPPTLVDYYQDETRKLRDLTTPYLKAHPEMAPIISGHMADPGVERLFEGEAFQFANLQMTLDDDFPEVIHGVMDVVQPNSLKYVPATTTIVFTPKANCTEPRIIPAGTEIKSVPVDGTDCRFTTRYPVEIHPLEIKNVSFAQPSGKPAAITLSLKLTGIALSDWKVRFLRLFLAGENKHALNLYLVLMCYVKRIVITPALGGQPVTLDATHLKAVGFEDTDVLFPTDASGAASHLIIHEYFIQPDKFLFLDLVFEKWSERGEGTEFEIRFELDKLPFELHQVDNSDFALFGTPAVNVFEHRAEPIVHDDIRTLYPVLPSGAKPGHYQVYSLEKVYSHIRFSTETKTYSQAAMSANKTDSRPTYQVIRRKAAFHSGLDTFVSVFDQPGSRSLLEETLYIDLLCTNGRLPEILQPGDVCKQTGTSPNFATFTNCKPVTVAISSASENNQLWRLLALCNINLGQLTTSSLRAILERISQIFNRDHASANLHTNQIKGIADLRIEPTDRLFGRSVVRGWEINIKLNREAYSSFGEMYLFGVLLDHFLRGFATQSCFTRTVVEDVQSTIIYEWPAKMGGKPLL